MKIPHLMFLLLVLLPLSAAAQGDGDRILNQQDELERIQREVERSQKRLDSLRNAESQTQGQISKFDEKITANQKVISRLTGQLREVQSQIAETELRLGQSRDFLEQARRKYLGDLRQFYVKATKRTTPPLWEAPGAGLESNRKIMYLAAVATFESGNIVQAGNYLTQTLAMLDTLTGEHKKVQSLKKNKEVATALDKSQKEKREKALDKIRRTKLAEGERKLSLQQAAAEIERVIAKLEEDRKRQEPDQGKPEEASVFSAMKGQLPAPVQGEVIVPFGPSTDPITKLKSYSPGITVKTLAGSPVQAVGAGVVAYVGNLRGYGRFVIISHDNQYYTTYAGLTDPTVAVGDYVSGTAVLGRVGADGQLKFELREGREPVDPIPWIRLDSF